MDDCLGLSGIVWDCLGLSGTVWDSVGLSGTAWNPETSISGLDGILRIRRRLSEIFETLLLLEHLAVLIRWICTLKWRMVTYRASVEDIKRNHTYVLDSYCLLRPEIGLQSKG